METETITKTQKPIMVAKSLKGKHSLILIADDYLIGNVQYYSIKELEYNDVRGSFDVGNHLDIAVATFKEMVKDHNTLNTSLGKLKVVEI